MPDVVVTSRARLGLIIPSMNRLTETHFHHYAPEGVEIHVTRVRITRGPFADVEGVLLRTKPNKGLLVISVELLRRSVAVEVDCTLGVPA